MERFYSWKCTESKSDCLFDVLAICYGGCSLESNNVYRDIETGLKSSDSLPDFVIIIGNSQQLQVFQKAWESNSLLENMLRRGQKYNLDFVKSYVFFEWNGCEFKKYILAGTDVCINIDEVLSDGIFKLIEKNNVIHQATSGHVFKHPSGNKNNVFIQARDVASEEAELFVVGYSIVGKYFEQLSNAEVVFIDTMGIYSYVKNALSNCNSSAEIRSFHSYDELESLLPPSVPYFCIISASTSGSMARALENRKFDKNSILTLIDVSLKERTGNILLALDSMKMIFPDLGLGEGTLIEIIGENFTSKAKPPRPVVIGISHQPKYLNIFHKYMGMQLLPFNISNNKRIIKLDPTVVFDNSDFNEWLEKEINWSLPISINLIIHSNDDDSKLLADKIEEKLRLKLNRASNIELRPWTELPLIEAAKVTGVLIVSAISRDGGELREISRDLRSFVKSNIPRHFISPIGIPQSSESWRQLKIFLMKNPSTREYGFSNWFNLPIGNYSGSNTWSKIADLGSEAQTLETSELEIDGIDEKIIIESIDLAVNEISSASSSLLNTPRGQKLELSEGFLFFGKNSSISESYKKVHSGVLFLTISAVLQCAREHEKHTLCLSTTGYESVVLAPECFLRFNDPVLQACFLRACRPEELDYSASPELSKHMSELVQKIFERNDREYGDAALEFAAAIAIGRLTLARTDISTLLNEHIKRASRPSALLGILILAKYNLKI